MSVLQEPIAHVRRPARFVAFGIAVVLVLSGLTVRLFAMQLAGKPAEASTVQAPAIVPSTTTANVPITSTRGLIYDRKGRPLVANVPTFTVGIRPANLPLTQRTQVAQRLAGLLGTTATAIITTLDSATGSRFDLVPIARNVPEVVSRLISEDSLTLPGVEVTVEPRRSYLSGSLFTQIVGWTGQIDAQAYADLAAQGYLPTDRIGRTGVEATYETQLRGTYGVRQVEKDGTGQVIRTLATTVKPVGGDSVVLTIDSTEQKLALKALQWGLKTAGVRRGAIIVENPQTGEILAMVSLPTYDGNLFSAGISAKDFTKLLSDPGRPLINHAIGDLQPPGSTFKIVTGVGNLADHKLGPTETVLSKPYVQIGPTKFWEWNHLGWGPLTIKGGFAHSSDTFFYQLSLRLGMGRLNYWSHQLGFAAPTGIDLPGEATGLIPSDQWKMDTFGQPIYPGELAQAGIGQGYDTATPLQVLNAYAAVANGGRLLQPQVVREIIDAQGNVVRPFAPKLIRKVGAPAWVYTTMRQAARQVVTSRHTYNLVDLPIVVAGKTGTAEFGLRDKYGVLPYHNWFVAFVPKNALVKTNPTGDVSKPDSELAVIAYVYDAGTLGNTATEIVKYYLQLHFGIKHDYRLPQLLEKTNFYQGPT